MKQNAARKLLSFMLTLALALALGLLSGRSLTALAAGTAGDPITINTWNDLKSALSEDAQIGESENNPTYYKLKQDITADDSNRAITVASKRYVVVDLDGKKISRSLTGETREGYVIKVMGNLTITGSGTITGGWNNSNGGGVYVAEGGTFTMESGKICENDAGSSSNGLGGGVYVAEGGTFTMMDGMISENRSRGGGGVYVAEGGTFTMKRGTISGNTAHNCGGGVYVNGGTFTMESGTISKNEVPGSTGGGVEVYRGTFTMKGGTISGNQADSGGGVMVGNSSTFTMDGGTISGNLAKQDGGGVCVNNDSTFTMTDGTISENSATNSGGGVFVFMGTFNMTGGNIGGTAAEKNTAEKGGGVNVFMGTFNMTGGTISGNLATEDGGGVYLYGTFNMTNGAISQNTATGKGGGVYLTSDMGSCTLNLSGNVDISGNKDSNVYCDECFEGRRVITVHGKLENTQLIGVTAKSDVDITSGFKTNMPDADPADFFKSDNADWGVLWNENKTEAIMAPAVLVTFNSNMAADSQTTKKQYVRTNTETELRANPFTRPGHSFTGWNTNADGTGTPYADEAKVTLDAPLELYAQWDASVLTVSSIADQTWTGQPITPTVTVKDGDTTLTLEKDYTVAYKDNTDVGTATVTVTGRGNYEGVTANAIFKIVKVESRVVTAPAAKPLTYNGQAQELVTAGVAEGGTMNYAIGKDDKTAPTDGWSESIPTGTDAGTYYVWYKAKGDATHGDSEPAFVPAIIAGLGEFTVTFNEMGHGTAPEPKVVQSGNTVEEPEALTAEGYTFGGWFKEKECTNAWNFDTDKVTANTTLYAKWTEDDPSKYTVIFDVKEHGIAPEDQKVKKGDKVIKPSDPTADGYTFEGWFMETECLNAWDFDTEVTSDITLFAKWTEGNVPIGVTLNLYETFLSQGMEKALKATTRPEGAAVTWSSSDNSVAYVDGRGVVIGLKTGTAIITATITVDGKEYSASCKVTVVPAGFIPSGSSDGGHTHKFVWVTIEATEDTDGELRYQCEICGEIQTRVPLTAYNVFNMNTTEKIRKASKDATVKIETNKWISFHKMVMEALADRPDVTLEISFLDEGYKGNRCTVVIPKGTDTKSLVDKNGFTGFLFLGGKFGMKTN